MRRDGESRYADTAFIVDEEYNGKGIATYLFNMLINIALQRGIGGFVEMSFPTTSRCSKSIKNSHTTSRLSWKIRFTRLRSRSYLKNSESKIQPKFADSMKKMPLRVIERFNFS